MTNKTQEISGVDLLINWMKNNQYFIGNDLLKAFEQAKERDKKQMIDFAIWLLSGAMPEEEAKTIANAYYKQFMKETYGGNK